VVAERPAVFAHRGASRQAPENTIAAFRIAAELGADGIELDVHRTADGALVVHHDADAAGLGLLVERSFAEVRAARADIPTLAESFAALAAHDAIVVNVEIKCCAWDPDPDPEHEVAARVVELVREIDAFDRVIVSSFDLGHVDAVRRSEPRIATGFLVHGLDPTPVVEVCAARGHGWLHPDWGNLSIHLDDTVRTSKSAGVRLNVWTVDDPDQMRSFADAGVDAIITNVPDLALAILTLPRRQS